MEAIPHESALRFAAFAGVLAVMAVFELLLPRRARVEPRQRRWFTNLAIVALDTLALRLLFPILAVGVAAEVAARGWGLLHWLAWPQWLETVLAVMALDLAIYGQHVASHKVPLLWRVHRVHHADRDLDVTTGVRFHPIEICLSMLYKFAVIAVIGAAPLAVFLFEVLLNATSMFSHANVRLPLALDRLLRLVIVTPDMHRVHHSTHRRETDANYGFNLSLWDHLFGSYIAAPRDGHEAMTIGLPPYQTSAPSRLGWSLALPFRSPRAGEDQ